MADWVPAKLHEARGNIGGSVLILGISFKEDVPDLRNSKVADLIVGLAARGHKVVAHDPHVDRAEAMSEFGLPINDTALDNRYDLVVLAVAHAEYTEWGAERLLTLTNQAGLFSDLRNALPAQIDVWRL